MPEKKNTKAIQVNPDGIALNWKAFVAAIFIILTGSGSYYGFQIITRDQLDKEIADVEKSHNQIIENQGKLIDDNKISIAVNEKSIVKIDFKLGQVQRTQHKDIARTEARRLTENIKDRTEREDKYDALLDLNISRLKKGEDPCSNLDCSN